MGFIETAYGGSPTLSKLDIDSDLNMKNVYDIIGVKRFLCQDFMGALLAVASDNLQETVILDDITGSDGETTKLFRVPSNFVVGSTIKIEIHIKSSSSHAYAIYKYDPLTETYTYLTTGTVSDTGGSFTWVKSNSFAVNAGDLITLRSSTNLWINGSDGVKIYYDPNAVSGAVWEVEEKTEV